MGAAVTDVQIGDLEELTACKGWAWLKARAEAEFGPAMLVAKLRKIHESEDAPPMKQAKTEQAFAAQAAVVGVLEMPAREIQKQREAFTKRPDDMAGMRRRGAGL
jgi:hypothetical protein